jgi:hypothetical protein
MNPLKFFYIFATGLSDNVLRLDVSSPYTNMYNGVYVACLVRSLEVRCAWCHNCYTCHDKF